MAWLTVVKKNVLCSWLKTRILAFNVINKSYQIISIQIAYNDIITKAVLIKL